jgi:betaine lipid synthase
MSSSSTPFFGADLLSPFAHQAPYGVKLALIVSGVFVFCACLIRFVPGLRTLLVFAYNCFLQPIGKVANQGQRLDRFYQNQASGE